MSFDLIFFQRAVRAWVIKCMGAQTLRNPLERSHRFLEEAVELAQATGATKDDAHKIVDYVYGRPVGQVRQEVGGTMITLAALCEAHEIELSDAASDELKRCWDKIEEIKERQLAKRANPELPSCS